MRVRILMLRQDDPKKCTAARMIKFDLAAAARRIGSSTILLDPFAGAFLLPGDRSQAGVLTAVDCSWNRADSVFADGFPGAARKLPPLLAGNPVNYTRLGRLTTAEAVTAALYILGDRDTPHRILDMFRWGHTFMDLNRDLLDDYAEADSQNRIPEIAAEYGLDTAGL